MAQHVRSYSDSLPDVHAKKCKRSKKRKYNRLVGNEESLAISSNKKRKYSKKNIQRCDEISKFTPNMSYVEAKSLRIGSKIDHRDTVGRFVPAVIIDKQETNLKIHYRGWDKKWDCWSDFTAELYRFAKYKSISHRPIFSINKKVQIGDMIDFNPIHIRPGWKKGKIVNIQIGQIQVVYNYKNSTFQSWTHYDCIQECAFFNTKIKNKINIHTQNEGVIENKYEIFKNEGIVENKYEMHNNKKTDLNFKIKRKINIKKWNTYGVIHWLNRIENKKFNNIQYQGIKQNIKRIQLKGSELSTLSDISLRFAGFTDLKDRKIILNNIMDLLSNNDNNNYSSDQDTALLNDLNELNINVPDVYCDPISCEIMEDPVLVSISGHTYDRQIIENCIRNNKKDPITQHEINKSHLVPNRALKQIIDDWKRSQITSKSK